jgi:hypothetical protein
VALESTSLPAMSLFERPRAVSVKISSSRGVRSPNAVGTGACAEASTKASISRVVTVGDSSQRNPW